MRAAAIVIYASDLDKPDFAAIARATGPSATRIGKADELDNAAASSAVTARPWSRSAPPGSNRHPDCSAGPACIYSP